MTLLEAARMARDALRFLEHNNLFSGRELELLDAAIEAAEKQEELQRKYEALVAAEKEQPVAWLVYPAKQPRFVRACWTVKPTDEQLKFAEIDGDVVVPLYLHPKEQK